MRHSCSCRILRSHDFSKFISDESGAVTVDWSVLAASVIGLGLSSTAAVRTGVVDLSDGIETSLSGAASAMVSTFGVSQIVGNFVFGGGDMVGWVGGRVVDLGGELGEMLVLGADETTSTVFDLPAGAETGTISFDFVGGDSLYNEIATITANGQTVSLARGGRGTVSLPIRMSPE